MLGLERNHLMTLFYESVNPGASTGGLVGNCLIRFTPLDRAITPEETMEMLPLEEDDDDEIKEIRKTIMDLTKHMAALYGGEEE